MKTSPHRASRHGATRQGQRGITLIVALLVLVSMSLAGIALLRSVDSATLLSGNLAFRQSATASADRGMESAIAVLAGMTEAALESGSGSGYYAQLPTADIDFTGSATTTTTDDFNWTANAAHLATPDAAGNTADYVVHRLCSNTGALSADTCTTWMMITEGDSGSGIVTTGERYDGNRLEPKPSKLRGIYRITVRISGPRNTYSYVQASVVI